MENDRLSTYLQARLRAVTYKCDDGLDDEVHHVGADSVRVIHGGWELAGLHMQVSISERRRRLL